MNYVDAPGYAAANAGDARGAVFEHEGLIDVPVTLVWGEKDRLLSARPAAPGSLPGARFFTAARTGAIRPPGTIRRASRS